MKIPYSRLGAQLSAESFAPAYVLSGEQELLRELALEEIVAATVGDGVPGFNLERIDGEKASAERIVSDLNVFPMLGGRRAVVVRRARRLIEAKSSSEEPEPTKGSPVEALLGYLRNPAPHSVLVLELERPPDARRKAWREIEKLATVVQCDPLREGEVEEWILAESRRRNLRLGREEARYLAAEFGSDLRRQRNELEKLSLYAAGRKLELDELAPVLGRGKAQSIFRFTDAVARRDASGALMQLGRLLGEGEPALRILALLDRTVGQLLVSKEALARGGRGAELARSLGVPPFVADTLLRNARRFTEQELGRGIAALADCDRLLKTTGAPERLLLERLVVTLCGRTGAGRASETARARR